MFYQAGVLLARMHEACCYLGGPLPSVAVRLGPGERGEAEVVLADVAGVQARRRPCPALAPPRPGRLPRLLRALGGRSG